MWNILLINVQDPTHLYVRLRKTCLLCRKCYNQFKVHSDRFTLRKIDMRAIFFLKRHLSPINLIKIQVRCSS